MSDLYDFIKQFGFVLLIIVTKIVIISSVVYSEIFLGVNLWWSIIAIPMAFVVVNVICMYTISVTCPKCHRTELSAHYGSVFIDNGPMLEVCYHYKCKSCGEVFYGGA